MRYLFLLLILSACATPKYRSPDEEKQRQEERDRRNQTRPHRGDLF